MLSVTPVGPVTSKTTVAPSGPWAFLPTMKGIADVTRPMECWATGPSRLPATPTARLMSCSWTQASKMRIAMRSRMAPGPMGVCV